MRNEIVSAERQPDGSYEAESLWILTDAEVSQLNRIGLERPQPGRNLLTQVHHVLSPARASTRGQRIIRRADGFLLHQDGNYYGPDAEAPWQYVSAGPQLARWNRRGAGQVAAYLFPRTSDGEDEWLDPQWQRETFVRDADAEVVSIADWKGALLDGQLTRGEPIERVQRTTLNLQVGASADDASQFGVTCDPTDATAIIDNTDEWGGWRFTGATASGTINSATLSHWVASGAFDEPDVIFDFEDADAGAQFTTDNNNISGRTLTGSTVAWDDADLGVSTPDFVTMPNDLSTPVQAVIDRGGYSDVLVLVMVGADATGARDLSCNFYDGGSSAASKLDIDYTAGGGGGNSYYYQVNQ